MYRLRVRAAGLAGASWMDKKNSLDFDLADSFDFHVHHTGLREASIQELVPGHVSHVHHLDWIFELRCRMDDHYNR